MHANYREEVDEVLAGDIIAFAGPKEIGTGDTLCSLEKTGLFLKRLNFPNRLSR